jgi:hypothetical protein
MTDTSPPPACGDQSWPGRTPGQEPDGEELFWVVWLWALLPYGYFVWSEFTDWDHTYTSIIRAVLLGFMGILLVGLAVPRVKVLLPSGNKH